MSSSWVWQCRETRFTSSRMPLVMGVLNVTPDSFSDGGRWVDPAIAIQHAQQMREEGADILDIGGESSRPGSDKVSAAEELLRVRPVLEALTGTQTVVSIDTTKAEVADAALDLGASIVNDISSGRSDPRLFDSVAESRAGVVLMHMQGTPKTMQENPQYDSVVDEVIAFLMERRDVALRAGVREEQIAYDPGIGFGKTLEHNLSLLRALPRFTALGRPVLIGVSRKRFLGAVTGLPVQDRLAPSLAALAWVSMQGADILRVHDVKESCAVLKVLDSLRHQDACHSSNP